MLGILIQMYLIGAVAFVIIYLIYSYLMSLRKGEAPFGWDDVIFALKACPFSWVAIFLFGIAAVAIHRNYKNK